MTMADIKFTGNIGKDPELKYMKGGDAVLSFSVADSKSRKLDNGEWETTSEQWLRVTVWRELAEFYAEKLSKGTRVTVYGEFMAREYEGTNGKGVSLDVTAEGIKVHPKRQQQQNSGWGEGPGF
jgi:single-strand DNA-binding protein